MKQNILPQYRVTVSRITAMRLKQLSLVHGVPEGDLINQLVARQYQHDKGKGAIENFVGQLDDVDTEGTDET